uniref:Uncharacterized protein n=1 Tax=viral metagenome TaxID=1070528 RepID=A0A6H1ZDK7_9ZZZZ
MKAKTIRKILHYKFESFLNSIEDEKVRLKIKTGTIITGGSIASMLCGEKVNDYDLYFKNHDTCLLVAQYFLKRFKEANSIEKIKCRNTLPIDLEVIDKDGRIQLFIRSSGVLADNQENEYSYFETLDPGDPSQNSFLEEVVNTKRNQGRPGKEEEAKKFRPIFLSANAITLTDNFQIVIRFYGTPEEIHENFDYVHCTNYWTSWNDEIVLRKEALESLLTKELRYHGSLYPMCSIIRLRKFLKRDWTINAGQMLKIMFQLNELDLKDVAVLREQLLGIDTAYFMQLLQALEGIDPDVIDFTYVAELVDKIF